MQLFQKRLLTDDGEILSKWFYRYKDSADKWHIKVCRNCSTFQEAQLYVSKLKYLSNEQYLIKNIASDMYLQNGKHLKRLACFGKKLSTKTCLQKRQILNQIIEKYGDEDLRFFKISKVEQYLIDDSHSGSWKNSYLETFSAIYDETTWVCDEPVSKPKITKFSRNSKKADIFSTQELNILFSDVSKWENYQTYLLFYIIASCGLRLGEARGLRVNQFNLKKRLLIVDGFCKDDGFRTNYNKKGSNEDTKLRLVPLSLDSIFKVSDFIYRNSLSDSDFLFTDKTGKILSSNHLQLEFNRAIERCNIPRGYRKLCPHSLRFTYVTRMRRSCTAEDVKKIVGHTSLKMTDYYTRFSIPDLEDSVNKTMASADKLFE